MALAQLGAAPARVRNGRRVSGRGGPRDGQFASRFPESSQGVARSGDSLVRTLMLSGGRPGGLACAIAHLHRALMQMPSKLRRPSAPGVGPSWSPFAKGANAKIKPGAKGVLTFSVWGPWEGEGGELSHAPKDPKGVGGFS
eukprot:9483431-Pyramimonas_sp.AAC.1